MNTIDDLVKLSQAWDKRRWDLVFKNPEQVMGEIERRVKSDPLLLDWVERHRGQSEDDLYESTPRRVGDVLAKRLLWMLTLARTDQSFSRGYGTGGPMSQLESNRLLAVHALLVEFSIPYLWDADIFEVVSHADMPPHTIGLNQLPFPMIWIAFSRQVNIGGLDDPVDALFVAEADRGLIGLAFMLSENDGCMLHRFELSFGTEFREADAPWPTILSAISFMESPYVSAERRTMNHRERRNAGRGRVPEEESFHEAVHFIQLRRSEGGQSYGEAQGSVDWKYRWLVPAYQRSQWYPSLQGHKIIWVRSHIKGPEGKPLKTPAYAVNR